MKRGSCIIADNGQRIIIKETAGKYNMDIKVKKEKLNIKVAELRTRLIEKLQNISESGKRYIKAGAVCAALLITGVVISVNFSPVYSVYLGDAFVGRVVHKQDFEKTYAAVNEAISRLDSPYEVLNYTPDYIFGIAAKSAITDENTLKGNIAKKSRAVRSACYITVDGSKILCVSDEKEAKRIIEDIRLSYGDSAVLLSETDYTTALANINNITDGPLAGYKLSTYVKVQTTETLTYAENVPYGTEYTYNNEKYEGQENVVSAGSDGKRTVTAKVTKINGVEDSREIVSYTEDVVSVAQVIEVGTKVPDGIGIGSFIDPTFGIITSRFGSRWGGRHNGLDIANDVGTPVSAADNGVVTYADYNGDFGNLIIIDHNNGYETYYAHLDTIEVAVGDKIIQGRKIGEVGNTGYSTGPHLHFEVRKSGVPDDPSKYLN